MASGSRIVLRTAAEADIPTPDTGTAALFMDSDASDAPAYKTHAGTVVPLHGATGATGPAGATGATGPAGATGATGVGATGATGPAGATGATGATGPSGGGGSIGATGPTGPTGPAGVTGATGPGTIVYSDHGNTGSTETIDASAADVHRLVLNAATVTVTLTGWPGSGTYKTIRCLAVQDATGNRVFALPASVVNPPTLSTGANAIDEFDLETVDGGTTVYVRFQAGPTGPTGPTGVAGATGATGPTGASGAGPGSHYASGYHSGTQVLGTGGEDWVLMANDASDTDNYHFGSAAALTGTVTKTSGSATIVGSGTSFTTELSVNQVVTIPGTAEETFVVASIADNTHFTAWQTAANTASGQTATRRSSYFAIPSGLGGAYILALMIGSGSTPNTFNYVVVRIGSGTTASDTALYVPAKTSTGYPRTVYSGTQMVVLAAGDWIQVKGTDSTSHNVDAGSAKAPLFSIVKVG